MSISEVSSVERVRGTVCADVLDRVKGPRAREDREPPKQPSLVGREDGVAPRDSRLQRAVPGRNVAIGGLEDGLAVAQPSGDLVGCEQLDAGRGESQCQREAVEPDADLGNRPGVGVGDLEPRRRGSCKGGEHGDRRHGANTLDVGHVDLARHLQRRHRELVLAGQMHGLAAGNQQGRLRAGVEEAEQFGSEIDHLLGIVEDQQGASAREPLVDERPGSIARRAADPQAAAQLGQRADSVERRRQVDEHDPVGEPPTPRSDVGDLEGEARLADSGRAGERQEPNASVEQSDGGRELPVPADEIACPQPSRRAHERNVSAAGTTQPLAACRWARLWSKGRGETRPSRRARLRPCDGSRVTAKGDQHG